MPDLLVHDSIDGFLEKAGDALGQDEVSNGLILGVALRVKHDPLHFEHKPYLATVHDSSGLIAAGLMTPPHGLVVYAAAPDPAPAMRLLAENLVANRWPLPTVNGVAQNAKAFAEEWAKMTHGVVAQLVAMRVFALRAVVPLHTTPGHLCQATASDIDVVFEWFRAFHDEALPTEVAPKRENVERSLVQGNLYVWETNGQPVSLAGKGRRTAHGVSVGPVYTPPGLRGRGYASACVAALSQLILDEGYDFCTLFTDLANPTSNSIYRKIGYRPVCDFTLYALRSTASAR